MVGICRQFIIDQQFVSGSCDVGAESRSVVGQKGGQASLERNIAHSAENSAAVTVKKRMYEFPWDDVSSAPKYTTLRGIPGLLGKKVGSTNQLAVSREVLRA